MFCSNTKHLSVGEFHLIELNFIEWVKHNFVHIKLFVALLLVRGSLWSMWSHGYVIMKITFIKLHYITLHHITLHCTLYIVHCIRCNRILISCLRTTSFSEEMRGTNLIAFFKKTKLNWANFSFSNHFTDIIIIITIIIIIIIIITIIIEANDIMLVLVYFVN